MFPPPPLPLTFKTKQVGPAPPPAVIQDSFRACSVLETFTPWPQS